MYLTYLQSLDIIICLKLYIWSHINISIASALLKCEVLLQIGIKLELKDAQVLWEMWATVCLKLNWTFKVNQII